MKDLGAIKNILIMVIRQDISKNQLCDNQTKYVENVLKRFSMKNAKPVSNLLVGYFRLSTQSCPTADEEEGHMSQVPYAKLVGYLMYEMIYTMPVIAHAVNVISKFMENLGKENQVVQQKLWYLKGMKDFNIKLGATPVWRNLKDTSMQIMQGTSIAGDQPLGLYLCYLEDR